MHQIMGSVLSCQVFAFQQYFAQRYQTIKHCHVKRTLIVIQDVCKLCDFGWAIYSQERRNTYCGTLDYVCP